MYKTHNKSMSLLFYISVICVLLLCGNLPRVGKLESFLFLTIASMLVCRFVRKLISIGLYKC